MDPRLEAICDAHGVFLWREAKALCYDDATIARLNRSGAWRWVRPGAYVPHHRWEGLTARQRYGLKCHAVYRQSKTQVALSHRSSADAWVTPLWEVDLAVVDVTRTDHKAGRSGAGVIQHRGKVADGDLVTVDNMLVMSPTRTALELTTLLDIEHAMVEIDDLLHRELTTLEALESRFATMNHWPDTLHSDLILRLVDGRSESVGETRLRYICWTQHLPAPIPNYKIRDRTGRVVARVDLAWPELGVFVEFDGLEKYQSSRRKDETLAGCVERERRRETLIIELTGWRVVRFVWADLYRPAETASRIRAQFQSSAA